MRDDDDFERRLGQRLRAYESRVRDAAAPDPRGLRSRPRFPWPILAGGGAALLAGTVLGFALLGEPAPVGDASPSAEPRTTPTASSQPTGTPAPTATPPAATATPAPAATPGTTLEWEMTASFGEGPGPAMALDVVAADAGLVAVGVQHRGAIPILGPTLGHDGRIWRSDDGTSWEDVTPGDTFANVTLDTIITRPDGVFVAVGRLHEEGEFGQLDPIGTGAWESTDGVTWTPTPTGLPEGEIATNVVQGGRGYLAVVAPPDLSGGADLWFSEDAQDWELVRTAGDGSHYIIDAGAEGFVAAGVDFVDGANEPFAIASADGREWFDATSPPPAPAALAALGGDWVVVSGTFEEEGLRPSDRAATWFSPNGLDWTQHGEVMLDSVPAEPLTCVEFPDRFTSAGPWMVLGSTLSYPCGEGGFVVHGTQRISIDGATWEALPFPGGSLGTSHSGSAISAAVVVDGSLVLVGQSDGLAAFWIGEQP